MECVMCTNIIQPAIRRSKRLQNKPADIPLCSHHSYLKEKCIICFEGLWSNRGRKTKNLQVIYRCRYCRVTTKTHRKCLEKFASCAGCDLKCFFCSEPEFRDYVESQGIDVPESGFAVQDDVSKEICNSPECSREYTLIRKCDACGCFSHEECLFILDNNFYCDVCISVFKPPEVRESDTVNVAKTQTNTEDSAGSDPVLIPTAEHVPDKDYDILGTIDLMTDSEDDDVEHLFDLMARPAVKKPRKMPLPLPPKTCKIDADLHYSTYHSEDFAHKFF